MIIGTFAVCMWLDRGGLLAFFGFTSYLAFKEYLSIIPTRRVDRRVLLYAYLAIPVQYYWVAIKWYGTFITFIPVFMFLLLPVRTLMTGVTEGFLKAVGTLHWGLMCTVFSISHIAYLMSLPSSVNPQGGAAGLLVFVLFLTEFNDVAQYCWGKSLSRFIPHKVVPSISPGKTWVGLIGGVFTSIAVAVALRTWLTPFTFPATVFSGVIISIGGFAGDVTMSAIKRDLGLKDSGSILPGHGGILDRLDSLTYVAPLFFHFVHWQYVNN